MASPTMYSRSIGPTAARPSLPGLTASPLNLFRCRSPVSRPGRQFTQQRPAVSSRADEAAELVPGVRLCDWATPPSGTRLPSRNRSPPGATQPLAGYSRLRVVEHQQQGSSGFSARQGTASSGKPAGEATAQFDGHRVLMVSRLRSPGCWGRAASGNRAWFRKTGLVDMCP